MQSSAAKAASHHVRFEAGHARATHGASAATTDRAALSSAVFRSCTIVA